MAENETVESSNGRGYVKTHEKMTDRMVGMVYGNQVTDTGRRKLGVVLFNLNGINNIQLFALESKVTPGNYQIYRADMAYMDVFKKSELSKYHDKKKQAQTKDDVPLYPPA